MSKTSNPKRESHGGVAFDVIIKPASGDAPVVSASPGKDRNSLSQQDIERKLEEAKERREMLEHQKLEVIGKDIEKVQEISQKVSEKKAAFAKETEQKLHEKMEITEENKKATNMARMEKLKEHDQHIEAVRKKKQEASNSA